MKGQPPARVTGSAPWMTKGLHVSFLTYSSALPGWGQVTLNQVIYRWTEQGSPGTPQVKGKSCVRTCRINTHTHVHTCIHTCIHTHSKVAGRAPTWPGPSGAPPEVAGRPEGAGRRPRAPPAHVTYVSSYSLTAHTKASPCTKVYSWFTPWPPREIWYQTGKASAAWAQKDLLVCQTTFGSSSYGDPNTLRREKHLPAIFHGSSPQSQADPGVVLTSALAAWPLASAAAWCQLSAVGPGAAPALPRQGLPHSKRKSQ